jgi:hypothetical protein
MQGHIHKRVRKNKSGKERTLWYVVVEVGVDVTGRRRQKWHGSFRTRKEARLRSRAPSSSTTCTQARTSSPGVRRSAGGSTTAGCR